MPFSQNIFDINACETATYSEAAALFKEKRELLERLSRINRDLRTLQRRNPDVVAIAREDVPFRNQPDRKLQKRAA